MKKVKMRTKSDCLVACIAMFSKRDYDHVYSGLLGSTKRQLEDDCGMELLDCFHYLNDLGLKISITRGYPKKGISSILCLQLGGGCAHAVFWDGKEIIDPEYDHVTHLVEMASSKPHIILTRGD